MDQDAQDRVLKKVQEELDITDMSRSNINDFMRNRERMSNEYSWTEFKWKKKGDKYVKTTQTRDRQRKETTKGFSTAKDKIAQKFSQIRDVYNEAGDVDNISDFSNLKKEKDRVFNEVKISANNEREIEDKITKLESDDKVVSDTIDRTRSEKVLRKLKTQALTEETRMKAESKLEDFVSEKQSEYQSLLRQINTTKEIEDLGDIPIDFEFFGSRLSKSLQRAVDQRRGDLNG